jgi:DNA polymerase-4
MGITTVGDLRRLQEDDLTTHFGKTGQWFYRIARGIDEREVNPHRERQSVGAEDTFASDLVSWEALEEELEKLSERVWRRLREISGRTVTLKVTYSDFTRITRSRTFERHLEGKEELLATAVELLNLTEATKRPIRLLGISVSNFEREERTIKPVQLSFPWRA